MSQPVRMCIVCRGRCEQKVLLRLQKDGDIKPFSKKGRSFYLCKECASKENIDKIMIKKLHLKPESDFLNIKKEFLSDG